MTSTNELELREKIGGIKIARNHRTETFFTLADHDEFKNIMGLIDKATREARLDEFAVVNGIWGSQEYSVQPASAGRMIHTRLLEHQQQLEQQTKKVGDGS